MLVSSLSSGTETASRRQLLLARAIMAVATESSHEGPDSEEGQRRWSNPSAADPFHPLTNGFEEAKVVGNREIGTTRVSSVQDLQSVLTVQKKAFLDDGTPDLKKRRNRVNSL